MPKKLILENGTSLGLWTSISQLKINKKLFEKFLGKKIVKGIKKYNKGDQYLKQLKMFAFYNFSYEKLLCKYCNQIKKDYRRPTCNSKKCVKEGRGSAFRGKKRPEHAIVMRKMMLERVATGKAWGKKHRANNAKHLNSLKFKKTVLRNKGIIYSNAKDVREKYLEVRSACVLAPKTKIDAIKRLICNPKYNKTEEFLTSKLNGKKPKFFDKLPLDKIDEWFAVRHSIVSTVAAANNPNMGTTKVFKKIYLNGLKFNIQGKSSLTTRSQYEANYIKEFEDQGIKWAYEAVLVPKERGMHRPDFFIIYKRRKIILEVKGFLRADYNREKDVASILATSKYCRKQGWEYHVCKKNQFSIENLTNDLSRRYSPTILRYLGETYGYQN